MDEWTIFGERLKAELTRKRISYRQFSEMSGITTTTICRYVNSQRIPRATEIKKVADILGVTCDYMLGLSDYPSKTCKSVPSAETERKTGRWINDEHDMPRCSCCGYMPEYNRYIDDYYYSDWCPNCGAMMKDGDTE